MSKVVKVAVIVFNQAFVVDNDNNDTNFRKDDDDPVKACKRNTPYYDFKDVDIPTNQVDNFRMVNFLDDITNNVEDKLKEVDKKNELI